VARSLPIRSGWQGFLGICSTRSMAPCVQPSELEVRMNDQNEQERLEEFACELTDALEELDDVDIEIEEEEEEKGELRGPESYREIADTLADPIDPG
jgi:hypothetical protein